MVAPIVRYFGRSLGGGIPFPRAGSRRPVGFEEFIKQPQIDSLFPSSLPFQGAGPRPGALPGFSLAVEPLPALPGVLRARPNLDPQDIHALRFRRPVPEPPGPRARPFPDDPRTSSYVGAEPFPMGTDRYTDIISPIVPGREGGARATFNYLPETELKRIESYSKENPLAAVIDARHALEDAADPEQFVIALQAARAVRRGMGGDPELDTIGRMLSNSIRGNARRMGIPDDVIESAPTLRTAAAARGLYKETTEMAAKGFNAQEQIAWPMLQSARRLGRSAKSKDANFTDEMFDSVGGMLFGRGGGSVMRLLRSGDINPTHAKTLLNEAADAYIAASKVRMGYRIAGKGIQATKGPTFAKASEGSKAQTYAFAMQTAKTPDEVSAISAMWRGDIKNPAYFDQLDDMQRFATERVFAVEPAKAWPAKARQAARIDEESIASANVAQKEFDAARLQATRPEVQGPIIRDVTSEGVVSPEAIGTVRSRRLDYSRAAGGAEGNPGRSPLPMWMFDGYTDPSGIVYRMRPELRGKTTMDLIFDGKRTATTRDTAWKVKAGDIIDFVGDDGMVARVQVTKAPYRLPAPNNPEHLRKLSDRWSELEGWDPSLYESMVGKWQFQYNLVDDVALLPKRSAQISGKGTSWGQKPEGVPSFEVSTKGTNEGKRYSAFNARIRARGNKSIEDIYQVDIKGGEKLAAGKYSKKGRLYDGPLTDDQLYDEYKNLWRQFFDENPLRLTEISNLTEGKKIIDRYASSDISQARAIYEILSEAGLWRGL